MSFFNYLTHQRLFRQSMWVIIFLLLALLLTRAPFNNLLIYPDWKRMPPLPNGETALNFTDVLARNRINVVTNQGHYYSCPYEAEENCWIPIPREVNSPKLKYPKGVFPQSLPFGTRKAVAAYGALDEETILIIATIQNDGQVVIGTSIYYDFEELLRPCLGVLCGMVLFPVLLVLGFNVLDAWYIYRGTEEN